MSVPNLAIVKVPPSSQAHLVPETKSLQVATTSSLPNLQIVLRNADDEPSCHLLIIHPPEVKQEEVRHLCHSLPDLECCRNFDDHSRSSIDQREMFIAQYSLKSAATYAKKILFNLDCAVWGLPGERLVVKYHA
ncbi:uncharacterized protein LOC136030884 [Artemia franciscana]|uniref:uncharacterized protein LOC136030884 n=1 Tax=Artemia franciscana TaxID=6661 RepID=UPI0032DB0B9B